MSFTCVHSMFPFATLRSLRSLRSLLRSSLILSSSCPADTQMAPVAHAITVIILEIVDTSISIIKVRINHEG
jgi:hypothetical protein